MPTPPPPKITRQSPTPNEPTPTPTPMRPDSPRANLVLPPPSSALGHHQQVRGDMTLPPLSTVSPLARPETAAFSLSNLVHHPQTQPQPDPGLFMKRERERDPREMSPGPSRVVRGRQSLPMPLPEQERDRDSRFAYHSDHPEPPPARSRPSSSRGVDSVPAVEFAPRPRTYEPRRSTVHPNTNTIAEHPPPPLVHLEPQPQPMTARPPPQTPGPGPGPGPQQWTPYPPPLAHPNPPHRSTGYTHRRSSSMAEAWFAVGDLPPRHQYGWSRDRIEGYHAGWEDALRSVEAGVFGVGGQQYVRPILVRKDIPPPPPPPPQTILGPPPLRQSSSSDPGPYIPMGSGSHRGSFEVPPIVPPRSVSFSSHSYHPPRFVRPTTATTATTSQRNSYSSTSMSMSMSPTSPGGERERKHRQAISCYPCRGRKLKCDGEKPCSQCVRRGGGGDCEYASSVRRRGKGKKGKSLDGEEGEDDDDSAASGEGEGEDHQ